MKLYLKLVFISIIATLSLLITLPRVPLNFSIAGKSINSYVGGYAFRVGDSIWDFTEFKQGLDIAGGIRLVLQADMSDLPEASRADALDSAASIIERRVNLFGVSEPSITTLQSGDNYQLVVEIPGVDDVGAAVSLIGRTAQLRFRELAPDVDFENTNYLTLVTDPQNWVDTDLGGSDLISADVVFSNNSKTVTDAPSIALNFTTEGRVKFSDIAKRNINKPIGVYLDDSPFPLSAPVVSPDLANGVTQNPIITGNFSLEDANTLSLQIQAGALPVPVQVVEQKTVGASLGNNILHASVFAGTVGLVFVLIFMLINYGKLGLIANMGLLIYIFITLAIFKVIPVVLTLPGIAGFILSVGMAVDASILIFERIKEEVRWGTPNNLALRFGFDRAWSSIKDANSSSLITAFILFYFGTGPVKGFAVTLAIGILVALFTTLYVVKTFTLVFMGGSNANS
ncbi:protein translocase subunit SecD [candidate division WWE3 bacterium]|uniref:Protein translocase subunit SecD n=1 Tax=candidate division WWE3 bacterium TaxID=2053526 RepID=A0A955EBW3_UNCKA|nr:protein translocase subunit SecD [candidate division WWE3 bacterium]